MATLSADMELARTLESLEKSERENSSLRTKISSFGQKVKVLQKQISKLEETNKELIHVNSQWDLEYKEVEEAFRRYRTDAQKAQEEAHEYIAKLKAEKEIQDEEIRTLKHELEKLSNEISRLSQRGGGAHHQGGGASNRMVELEEEAQLLKQQLRAYQEDFEAERRDRERLSDEKQSTALRYEAEITSLRLQLDRCRNELAHYSTEANRLAQQLRLKKQYEEEQFKQHLESNGYKSRSPNGTLPLLDPYVEVDQHHGVNRSISRSDSNLYHSSEQQQTQSRANGHEGATAHGHARVFRGAPPGVCARGVEDWETRSAPSTVSVERTKPPSPSLLTQHRSSAASTVYTSTEVPRYNGRLSPTPVITPPLVSNGIDNPPVVNGISHTPFANGIDHLPQLSRNHVNHSEVSAHKLAGTAPHMYANPDVSKIPPLQTKGKYSCPRCARRFGARTDCDDHILRCL